MTKLSGADRRWIERMFWWVRRGPEDDRLLKLHYGVLAAAVRRHMLGDETVSEKELDAAYGEYCEGAVKAYSAAVRRELERAGAKFTCEEPKGAKPCAFFFVSKRGPVRWVSVLPGSYYEPVRVEVGVTRRWYEANALKFGALFDNVLYGPTYEKGGPRREVVCDRHVHVEGEVALVVRAALKPQSVRLMSVLGSHGPGPAPYV